MISILVGFLSGLTGGLAFQNISGVLSLPADRIVLGPSAPGATPSFADSTITADQADAWLSAMGVTAAAPLGISQVRAESGDNRIAVALFGMDQQFESRSPSAEGTVTLSEPAATQLKVAIGDTITIAGNTFRVAGIDGADWYSHTPIIRTTLQDWQSIATAMGTKDAFATALAVRGSAEWATIDADTTTVSTSLIGSLTTLPAFRSEIGSLALIVFLLFGISALVIGAFFTVWTMQRKGDIAVLKALGATTGALIRDALGQALVVLLAGTAIGMGVVAAAALALGDALPFLLSPLTTVAPGVLMIALGLIGAAFALRTVTSTDPLNALGSNR